MSKNMHGKFMHQGKNKGQNNLCLEREPREIWNLQTLSGHGWCQEERVPRHMPLRVAPILPNKELVPGPPHLSYYSAAEGKDLGITWS